MKHEPMKDSKDNEESSEGLTKSSPKGNNWESPSSLQYLSEDDGENINQLSV